jgi:hypothetical protein
MSFDDQIQKQKRIVNHIKTNLPIMTADEVRDYSQEFFRCDRILNHQLRGPKNPAGRYLSSAVFGLVGIAIVLHRKPIGRGFFRSISYEDPAIIFGFFVSGYYYGASFHGNYREHKRLLGIYNEQSKPLTEEFHKLLDKH